MSDLDTLQKQNESLNEQIKLLVKAEKRLDQSQKELQRQLRYVKASNRFSLETAGSVDTAQILLAALKTLFSMWPVDQGVGFLVGSDGHFHPLAAWAASGYEGNSKHLLKSAPPVAGSEIWTREPQIFARRDAPAAMQAMLAATSALFEGGGEEDLDKPDEMVYAAVPLSQHDGQPLGMLLFRKLDPEELSFHEVLPSDEDLPFIKMAGTQFETTLANTLLFLENQRALEEQRRLAQELEIARVIQQSMLPANPPPIPELEIAFCFHPADEVAGDYYDVVPIGDRQLALAIGDVNGHGIGSALVMAMAKSAFHTQAEQNPEVPSVMSGLNNMIFGAISERRFMTFIYATIDLEQRKLVFSNAGHPYPYHLSGGDGSVVTLQHPPVYPLGVRRKVTFPLFETSLTPGDMFVFYSDGIPEGRNARDEEFGFERLQAVIQQHRHASASALRDGIMQAFRDFGAIQEDDITLMVLKYQPTN